MDIMCLPIMNVGMSGEGAIDIPPILNDGNTDAWFDFLQNITKDGSDFVSVWGDKSSNSNDLLQAVGTNQPLFTSAGVLFDGIDNFMKCVPFPLIQPEFIYIVLKQITWASGPRIFDGNTANTSMFQQAGITPDVNAYSGSPSGASSDLVLDTFGIVRVLFNGASSKLIVNENTPITGDFGSAGAGGFTLGSSSAGALWTHIQVKEAILRKIADAAGDEAAIYNYLKSKYGIS